MADDDPFRVLGLAPGASVAEVKHAYRALSARYHPDAAASRRGDGLVESCGAEEVAERFLAVQRAYEVLTDRHRRAFWESRSALLQANDDIAREGSPRTGDSLSIPHKHPASGHLPSAVTAFWRERRDALRKLYWVVSFALGIVIVSISLAPLKLSGGRLIDRLWSAHRPNSPDPDEHVPPRPNATLPPSVSHPPPAVNRADSFRTSRPEGVPDPGHSALVHAAPDPATPSAFPDQRAVPTAGLAESIADDLAAALQPEVGRPEPDAIAFPTLATAASAIHRAVPLSGDAAQPTPDRNPPWHGSWTAACLLPQPGRFFLGELELAGDARFRWRQVRTAGLRASNGAPDDRLRVVFHLEPDTTSARRLALREGTGAQSKTAAMLELTGGSQARLSFPNASMHTPPGCRRWQLYRQSPPAPLEGLWVLAADPSPSGARIAPAYLELRIARRGPHLEAVFQGQYTVPVASIAPMVQFRFRFPAAESLESIPWQDDAGSRGAVSLVPVTASRLAVHWVRLTPSQGRPQLSSGVSILRRME